MPPNLSILIITYNRPGDTLALLESLKAQNGLEQYVGEILLLNNASTVSYAGIENFIRENPKVPIRYIDHNQNLGVAGGRNFLIDRAKYPVLFTIDDDIVLKDKDTIKTAHKLFSKKQYRKNNTGIITVKVFYFSTGKHQKNVFPQKNYNRYKDKDWFLTYYFAGGAHLMKKELFQKTGSYPEDFFYGMEEYDLSYRIIDAGYTLAYDDSIKLWHKESPDGRVTNAKKLAMMWYNKCVVAWRYLPSKYFYSTALMWALQYLKETKFDLLGMLKTLLKITKIPKNMQPQKISKKSLAYLKKVEARLWY